MAGRGNGAGSGGFGGDETVSSSKGRKATKKGRPSGYKPEYAEQARKLCLLGATDQEIADFFEVTPTEDDFLKFALYLIRDDRSGVIAARKKERAATRRDRSTASGRIRNSVSARMWAALKGRSDGALFSRLGYDVETLMRHLESKFHRGMGWDNYGKWHVDHIRPCAEFDMTDERQFQECWSLSNLQPLWAPDNCRKGASNGAT